MYLILKAADLGHVISLFSRLGMVQLNVRGGKLCTAMHCRAGPGTVDT